MKKTLRYVAAALLLAASVSGAYSKSTMGLSEGPSPVPLCDPTINKKCPMPASPTTPDHR
jgi:hypothetical protein